MSCRYQCRHVRGKDSSLKRPVIDVIFYSLTRLWHANIGHRYKLSQAKTHHCAHSLLPPVKSCTHYLRPKGHVYELLRCDSELYKKLFVPYPVASFGICHLYLCLYGICVFIFLLPLSFLNCTCTFVTCLLNINQSINLACQ